MVKPTREAPPPLQDEGQVITASAADLFEQLRWELQAVRRGYHTNEALAAALGYAHGSSVTRWLSGEVVLADQAARRLDELGHRTTIGEGFTALRATYLDARRQGRAADPRLARYDIFLASPDPPTHDPDDRPRAGRAAKRALETAGGYSVYHAGGLSDQPGAEASLMPAATVLRMLRRARFFVLVAAEHVVPPSDLYVEAGFALARRIPSLYVVAEGLELPVVLRRLDEQGGEGPPPVTIRYVASPVEAVALLESRGRLMLQELAALSGDARRARGAPAV
jgi:hypothetical protein